MKRQIKFRCWNGEQMVSPDYIDRNGTAWWKENSIPTASKEVMQYTGLKDKYGKEIYEGDIVKQEKWVSVGKYAPAIGVVKYKSVKFTCECIGDWSGSNADLNGNAEVIGNIYENPDLIK